MQAMQLGTSGGLERLKLVELPDPQAPGTGEIQVRIRGSSLNFHDYAVARFDAPHTVGRIPMADGAGVVEAIGAGVTEFAPGDTVVSTFFPQWLAGQPGCSWPRPWARRPSSLHRPMTRSPGRSPPAPTTP
jgi:NADPH:quinone reductase-like Zn-dependent oxidoreductase